MPRHRKLILLLATMIGLTFLPAEIVFGTSGVVQAAAAVSVFGGATPTVPSEPDTSKVEVGMQFRSSLAGQATGVRFYKSAGNSGTHTGSLWRNGTRLATLTFTSESASGWQSATFAAPVALAAGTTYTVSYLAPRGHYADDQSFPWPRVSGPLTGIKGVYLYGGGYPTKTWNNSNYWVDVSFTPTAVVTSTISSSTSTVASSSTATNPTTAPPPTGWFTSDANGRILDPTGKEFVPVGVNANGPDWVWNDATIGQSANMDKWRFNTLRLNACYVGGCPSPDGTVAFDWHTNDNLDGIVSEYTAKKYVIMIDSHMWSGGTYAGHEQAIVDWWKATAARYKDNPYVWFNLINEPTTDPNGQAEWSRISTLIAQAIRSVAPQNMLVMDGATWGQDKGTTTCDPSAPAGPDSAHPWQFSSIVNSGPGMEAAFGPVAFSVHTYGWWGGNEANGCTPALWDATFKAYVDKVHSLQLPLLIGEAGAHVTKAEETGTEGGVWNATQMLTRVLPTLPVKVGLLFWHGSGGAPYNLYAPFHSWTDYDQFKGSLNWMGQFVYAYAHQVNPVVTTPPTTTPVTSTPPTTTAPPTTAPTTTTTTSTTPASTTPTTTTTTTTRNPGVLNLPRIPWEGGPDYYSQFPQSAKSGWTDPSWFPIGIWYPNGGNAVNASFDKSKGINTYWENNPDIAYDTYTGSGMQNGGGPNSTFPPSAQALQWPGWFLEDEIDGRYDVPQGLAAFQQTIDSTPKDGRFQYANFTAIVAANYNPTQIAADDKYVNMYEGPVSVDAYWYTDPHCSITPYSDVSFVPVNQSHCRTASSYGKTIQGVRARDASDGKLKPVWSFVELMGTGSTDPQYNFTITPSQLQGAAMDTIINEARGIVWFNQRFNPPCVSGTLIRTCLLYTSD